MALRALPEPGRSEYQAEFLQMNPTVVGPVRALLALQSRYLVLDQQFQEEMLLLEQQHYDRCQGLFQEREAIIRGIAKKKSVNNTPKSPSSHNEPSKPATATATEIPHFWLRAMLHNPRIARWIQPRDEPVLSYLRDIRIEFGFGKAVPGYKVCFDFDDNPFFDNRTLTKSFLYKTELDRDDIYGERTCDKAPGCHINWRPGRDPTAMLEVAPGQIEYESFFDFFLSTSGEDDYEGSVDNSDHDESDDQPRGRSGGERHLGKSSYAANKFDDGGSGEVGSPAHDVGNGAGDDEDSESALDYDIELGKEFKDGLVPFAIHWYTGEARLYEDEEDDEDDGEEGGNEGRENVVGSTVSGLSSMHLGSIHQQSF
ncbi:hypothetical protein B0O99DRAFT_706928 [Bisporella sp. PMI_857]|nr:hypothetical protein B0O99DRAFT_706928 [Bisporella sp. PMI_857]